MDPIGAAPVATMKTPLQGRFAPSGSPFGVTRIATMNPFQRRFALSRASSVVSVRRDGPSHQNLNGTRIPLPSCYHSTWKHGQYCSIVAQRESLPKSSATTRLVVARHGESSSSAETQQSSLDEPKAPGKKVLEPPSTTKSKAVSVAHIFGGVVLAIGFGLLRFSKPAFAENVAVAPPTVTATLNDKGEVEVHDAKLQDAKPDELGNDAADAADAAENSAQEADDDFEPLFGEGSDLTTDHAEVILRSYLEMHPEDKKAMQALLFLRLKKGEVDAALSVLAKLIELEPDNLDWKYIKAQADEYAGDLPEARQGYEDIIRIKPTSARAWQGLIVLMHKAGEDEPAELMLKEAIRRASEGDKPKDVLNLRMLLGQLYTIQGDLEKAMDQYSLVVKEDPTDYRPYLCQGLVFSLMGEEEEAEKYLRRYRKLCPKDFPQRGFLDDLLLTAKGESQKLSKRAKQDEELKAKGKKRPKDMRQPLASGSIPSKGDEKSAR